MPVAEPAAAVVAEPAECMVQTQSQHLLDKAFLIEWTLLPEGSSKVG